MAQGLTTQELIDRSLEALGYNIETLSEPAQRMCAAVMTIVARESLQLEEMSAEFIGKPSVLMRPDISIDGNKWCALYGNPRTGVAGFGDSVAEAMQDFDRAWVAKVNDSVT